MTDTITIRGNAYTLPKIDRLPELLDSYSDKMSLETWGIVGEIIGTLNGLRVRLMELELKLQGTK